MPWALAAAARAQVCANEKLDLELERNPTSKTGFTQVVQVGGKFQARLQVPGDGRGGSRKRRQVCLPGLFETAQEAAEYRALIQLEGPENIFGPGGVPPRQIAERKPRSQQPLGPAAATPLLPAGLPVQMPAAMTMAVPPPFSSMHPSLLAASPLPMQPLGYFAPRFA